MAFTVCVVRVIGFIVSSEARGTFPGFFRGGISIVGVPIVVAAAGQSGGYGSGGDPGYLAVGAIRGVENDIANLNPIGDKISIAVTENRGIIAAGVGAPHRHRGKVLAGRRQGLSQRGPGLGVVALISPVVDVGFYFIPRGADGFQELAALSEIWALNANVVRGAPYRAVAAVHSHQTKAHIGKIINDILYHSLGSNPARAGIAPHGTGVVQDDENIWFAGLC